MSRGSEFYITTALCEIVSDQLVPSRLIVLFRQLLLLFGREFKFSSRLETIIVANVK